MPHINPIVDLGNAISLKYTLPIGAHDLTDCNDPICVRPANENDLFLPFGCEKEEKPDVGEVVYAVGNQVRTRRWTWRQSEYGKILPSSKDIFFPIDGFVDVNRDRVIDARNELEEKMKTIFGCETKVGFVDAQNSEIEL